MSALLGIDPSLVATGWILLYRDQITFGCIKTAPEHKVRHTFKSDDTTRRLALILGGLPYEAGNSLTKIACEQPAGAQSASAASALGEVHGALVGFFWACKILSDVRWVPAKDGKRALTGSPSASKGEMAQAAEDWIAKNASDSNPETSPLQTFIRLPGYTQEAVADSLGVLLASGLVKK